MGSRVGWRSLITFGYSGDVQVPHRKGCRAVIFFDREEVAVVMLRFKLGCWLLKQIPYAGWIYHVRRHSLAKL